jgi:F-type H+-transporting ATPase subunit beta
MSEKHIGEVVQVTGPVLDIRFPEGELPALLNAIEIDNHGEKLVVEVAQQTGDNMVRCIAMKDLSAEQKQSTRAARSPFRSERSA